MKKQVAPGYQKADLVIDKMLRADQFSSPVFNRSKTALIKRYAETMPSIHYVARPQLKLGGIRFNPENYTFISNTYFKRLVYFDLQSRKATDIRLPAGAIVREVLWAPDGKNIAISVEENAGQSVYVIQAKNLKRKKIGGILLNSSLSRVVEWVGSEQLILGARTARQKLGLHVGKTAPIGPVIQDAGGVVSQNRTYTDLIKTHEDESLLALAIEIQLVLVHVKSGKQNKIGKPGFYGRVTVSPSDQYILIDTYLLPFSKVVPINLFAKKIEVWNLNAKVIYGFKPLGPHENLPIEGVTVGPRSIRWIENEPNTLLFAEALDQGNWAVKAEYRDELFKLKILKSGKPKKESVIRLKQRFAGFESFDEPDSYWIVDYERDRQWVTYFWVKKDSKNVWQSETIFSLNENDAYGDPGNPVQMRNVRGEAVIALDRSSPGQKFMFLSGAGASEEGERPFLKRFNLQTKESEEWFRSVKGTYERFAGFLKNDFSEFITAFESPQVSPRFFIRKPKTEKSQLLYADPNPYQILSKIKKEVITYERNDGVKLSGILYYPLNYKEGTAYPAILQAYPLEYTDAATAGQVRGSQDTFWVPYHDDMIYNTLRGYFVLDEAQMPIIGHPETKNDTFVEQLTASAAAAVDALVKKVGVDPARVGVVGHSYGAYMVANLLTHSKVFAAGVAKSGAYNRTLTPFGFQGERRPFWKAKTTYLKMSPFLEADQMKTPFLLIHGMSDSNMGTFPIQSERYFDALKGQGATARLVMLPEESHGFTAYESVGHVLHEVFAWFDQYLKSSRRS